MGVTLAVHAHIPSVPLVRWHCTATSLTTLRLIDWLKLERVSGLAPTTCYEFTHLLEEPMVSLLSHSLVLLPLSEDAYKLKISGAARSAVRRPNAAAYPHKQSEICDLGLCFMA